MCCTSIPGSWAASSQSEAARRTVTKEKLRVNTRSFFPVQWNTTRRPRLFFPQTKRRRQGRMPEKARSRPPAVPLRHRLWAFFGRGCPQGAQQPLYFSKKATTFISRTSFKISSSSNHQESPRYFLLPMYAQRASSASTHTGQTSQ